LPILLFGRFAQRPAGNPRLCQHRRDSDGLSEYVGRGHITSASQARADEGTTYEGSCYTDPVGIEHLTGSLAKAISHFGAWQAPVQLRFTTKYGNFDSLLTITHNNHRRIRFSVNSAPVAL